MVKNETSLIKSSIRRTLTAKGNKFCYRLVDVAAKQRGLTRYHKEFRPLKEKLLDSVKSLIIDHGKNEKEIKLIIKRSLHQIEKN